MVSVGLLAKAAASINSIILGRVCPRLEPLEPPEREREREGERRGSSESNTSTSGADIVTPTTMFVLPFDNKAA